jgi:4'-phosphopantetheinyl transferase
VVYGGGVDAPATPLWSLTQRPLREGELRVFHAFSASLTEPARAERCRALLSEEERAREARFRFASDRESYLLAHALCRHVLAQLCEVPPCDLRFVNGEHGRPELAAPERAPRLRFNLSHTRGLVACGVALEHDLGVDVEHIERRLETDRLAESVFSERERAGLAHLPPEQRRTRFFELWTLKEAYIKAVGVGLGMRLRAISLTPDAAFGPSIAFEAPVSDDPAAYYLHVRPVGPAHMLAVVLRRPVPSPVLIQAIEP